MRQIRREIEKKRYYVTESEKGTNAETEKDGLSDRVRLIDKQIYRGKVTQIETEADRA